MTALVHIMELEEAEQDAVFNFDAYPPDVQDQARAPMALLGSLGTDAVGRCVRAQVDGGNKTDVFLPWHGLAQRLILRPQLAAVGLLGQSLS